MYVGIQFNIINYHFMLEFVNSGLYFVQDENNFINPLLQVGSGSGSVEKSTGSGSVEKSTGSGSGWPKITGSDRIRNLIPEKNWRLTRSLVVWVGADCERIPDLHQQRLHVVRQPRNLQIFEFISKKNGLNSLVVRIPSRWSMSCRIRYFFIGSGSDL